MVNDYTLVRTIFCVVVSGSRTAGVCVAEGGKYKDNFRDHILTVEWPSRRLISLISSLGALLVVRGGCLGLVTLIGPLGETCAELITTHEQAGLETLAK